VADAKKVLEAMRAAWASIPDLRDSLQVETPSPRVTVFYANIEAIMERKWREKDVFDVIQQLHDLHRAGWVHGNVVSHHVLLTADRAVLLDFGDIRRYSPLGEQEDAMEMARLVSDMQLRNAKGTLIIDGRTVKEGSNRFDTLARLLQHIQGMLAMR
jgi:tRNA A-37 threonylcarbamoyl transferase component Bud32